MRFGLLVRLAACVGALAPGTARATSLSLDRGPVVLGRTESVGVTVRIDESPGTEDRPLRLAVNVGSFGEVTRVKQGVYRVVYVPPSTRFPQVALVAIWRETGPEAPIDFLKIPLYGSSKLPISAKPGAQVNVQVGPDSFGPITLDKTGKGQLPVVIPPGIREALVAVKEPNGLVTTKKLPIEVPEYNRLTAALVPHAIVADGQSWARLEVFYDLGGVNLPVERVKPDSTVGSVSFLRAERGRYTYRYVPPAGSQAKDVEFFVSIDGDNAASAFTKLKLGLPAPTRIVVRPPERVVAADGVSKVPVGVLVFDGMGLGLPGQKVELSANGAPLEGVTYRGEGVYEGSFTAPSVYPAGGLVQFVARVGAAAGTANYQLEAAAAPKDVTARLSPHPLPADGRSEGVLSLDVRDGAGLPLKGAKLILVASHGTLGPLEEVSEGRYQASYTAPRGAPDGDVVLKVVDQVGGFERSVPLPVRERAGSFGIGVRGGFTHSLGDQLGPRIGADVWVPFRLGGETFGAGLSAQYARATQTVTDGAFSSVNDATFVPITLRLAYELYASRRLSVLAGAGPQATFVSFHSSLDDVRRQRWGVGALGFVGVGYVLGPGQAFVELSYAFAPVEAAQFRLDGGGLGVEIGYRFGVL